MSNFVIFYKVSNRIVKLTKYFNFLVRIMTGSCKKHKCYQREHGGHFVKITLENINVDREEDIQPGTKWFKQKRLLILCLTQIQKGYFQKRWATYTSAGYSVFFHNQHFFKNIFPYSSVSSHMLRQPNHRLRMIILQGCFISKNFIKH